MKKCATGDVMFLRVMCRTPFSGKAHTSPAAQQKRRTYSTSQPSPPPTRWKIRINYFHGILSVDHNFRKRDLPFLLEAAWWQADK